MGEYSTSCKRNKNEIPMKATMIQNTDFDVELFKH